MSAVMEAPKPQIFDAVNYFDRRVVGSNVKRWVWFALDLIVPERKAEIEWLRVGGEETTIPCLQRYGRGFVPRGLSALLELGGEPIPMRHLGDLQAVAWQGLPLNENAIKNNFGFVPVYPGDGLRVLRRYSMNDGGVRKGLDEDTALMGKEWEECHTPEGDGILDVIERAMFGDGMEPTLSGLEDQIRHAHISDTRIDVGKLKADRLRMCGESRNWATRKVTYEHGLLKSGTIAIATDAVGSVGGWSYSYSPITEMLLQQLDIPRQDQPLQEMAKMFERAGAQPSNSGMSATDLNLIDERMKAMQSNFETQLETRLAAAATALQSENEELKKKLAARVTYSCDYCEREFDTPQGKSIHMNQHCPKKPTGD